MKPKNRCIVSYKIVDNREVILKEYAKDYLEKEGYKVIKPLFIFLLILFLIPQFTSAIATVPVNLTEADIYDTGYTALWDVTDTDNDEFRLEISQVPNFSENDFVYIVNGSERQRDIIGLLPNTTYHWRIRGEDIEPNLTVSAYANSTFNTTLTQIPIFNVDFSNNINIWLFILFVLIGFFLIFIAKLLNIGGAILFFSGLILLFSSVNIFYGILLIGGGLSAIYFGLETA